MVVGAALALSEGVLDLSDPARKSAHMEGLVEVNTQVEAAVDRAQNQLQVGYDHVWYQKDEATSLGIVLHAKAWFMGGLG